MQQMQYVLAEAVAWERTAGTATVSHLVYNLLLNYLQKQAVVSGKSWCYAVCLVEHKLNTGLKISYLPTGSILSMCVYCIPE